MDDPFHLSLTSREQPIYSNTSILEHKVESTMRHQHKEDWSLLKLAMAGQIDQFRVPPPHFLTYYLSIGAP